MDRKVNWSCIHRQGRHEVGCPHREWSKEELLSALITKKEFEFEQAINHCKEIKQARVEVARELGQLSYKMETIIVRDEFTKRCCEIIKTNEAVK